MGLLLRFVLTAITLRVVALFSSRLETTDWGSAFLAALVFIVVGTLILSVVDAVLPKAVLWQFPLIVNTISVAISARVLRMVGLRGIVRWLMAGILLTIVQYASDYLVFTIRG